MRHPGGRFGWLVAMGVLLSAASTAATRDDFLHGSGSLGPVTLPFRYFVPPGYDPSHAYPLILFLHGAGERGTDNEAQLDNQANGAMRLLDDANLAEQPVFMVAPQCWGWWSGDQLEAAVRIVDQLAAQFSIDPQRIYITGLSMGGMGTWSAVTAHPGKFAAAVPMSGNGDPADAATVRALPFWFFHAANDGSVPVWGSRNLVSALRDAGGDIIYTEYASGGHAIWPVAYTHPQLFPWLVSQSRGAPHASIAPMLRITDPTAAPTWNTEADTLDLAGNADLGASGVSSVTWSVLGGASGSAGGGSAWTATSVPVSAPTNLVRVIASGASGHPAYAGATTVNDHLWVGHVTDRIFSSAFETIG
ncbi:MAG: prolyl oligopeptidase family serine peptidase [Dokdonella sp.]|nr:MAG: prolyl oligopeptidase family serine peptidase [Dokdonella sp.]